jgi:hypothetical protein
MFRLRCVRYTNCSNFSILVLVKRYLYHDFVIAVSMCIDGVLLRMVILTETCKG